MKQIIKEEINKMYHIIKRVHIKFFSKQRKSQKSIYTARKPQECVRSIFCLETEA